jgi:hypothetical protein
MNPERKAVSERIAPNRRWRNTSGFRRSFPPYVATLLEWRAIRSGTIGAAGAAKLTFM